MPPDSRMFNSGLPKSPMNRLVPPSSTRGNSIDVDPRLRVTLAINSVYTLIGKVIALQPLLMDMSESSPRQETAVCLTDSGDIEVTVCGSCGVEYKTRESLIRHLTEECPEAGYTCEKCCRTFPTKRGLAYHTSQSHDEKMYEKVECEYCGKTEYVQPNRAERYVYCSNRCNGKATTQGKGERFEIECEVCEDVFQVKRSRRDAKVCGMGCFAKLLSEKFSGSGNPSYKGGEVDLWRKNWKRQRRKALERDNRRCQGCGKDESELNRGLSVHHIIPRRDFVDDNGELDYEKAHKLDNLVCLCRNCHLSKWEGIPLKPQLID